MILVVKGEFGISFVIVVWLIVVGCGVGGKVVGVLAVYYVVFDNVVGIVFFYFCYDGDVYDFIICVIVDEFVGIG